MLSNKKYFSITEVETITKLPSYTLRYIEKTDNKCTIQHIRGRRYYTKSDIEYILANYCLNQHILEEDANIHYNNKLCNDTDYTIIISKIDSLITRFSALARDCLAQKRFDVKLDS